MIMFYDKELSLKYLIINICKIVTYYIYTQNNIILCLIKLKRISYKLARL